jgi:hypothetical protein
MLKFKYAPLPVYFLPGGARMTNKKTIATAIAVVVLVK